MTTITTAVGRTARTVGMARGAGSDRARRTKMTLTTRGKAVLAGLSAAAVLAVSLGAWNVTTAESAPGVQQVTSYVVRPGDTLWSYAQDITPNGGDVRDTVTDLMELNSMTSPEIVVGQRLVVPVEE